MTSSKMLSVNVSTYCGVFEICLLTPISCRYSIRDRVVNVRTGEGHQYPRSIHLTRSFKSSSFIATVAGQAVSEGFIQWRVSVSRDPIFVIFQSEFKSIFIFQAAIRRVVTCLIAIIPSMVVAIAVGKEGIDALLVASQVILAIVLPFVTVPLLYCTSSKTIMQVRKHPAGRQQNDGGRRVEAAAADDVENDDPWVDFSNGRLTTAIGILILIIEVVANAYVLISLAMGIN